MISEGSSRASGGVVRFQPAVLPPGFGGLAELLLALDVLGVRLDPVALCIAAGVHGCVATE